MVSNVALIFVMQVLFLGVWMARWKNTDKMNFWWKPALYLFVFYVVWGFAVSLFPVLIQPE